MTKDQMHQANELERKISMYGSVINGINRLRKSSGFEIKIWEKWEHNPDKFMGLPSEWMSQELIEKTFELWESHFKSEISNLNKKFDEL